MRLKRRLMGFCAFSKNGISVAILLAAGLAAGCSSDFSRFTEGISKSSAPKNSAQPQYSGSYPPAPVDSSAYRAKVESSELAPPPGAAAAPAAASPAAGSAAAQRSQSLGQMPAESRRQAAAAEKNKKHKISYKVAAGDTLLGLGRRYDTSAEDIKRDNQLSSDKILIGQKLTIFTTRKEQQSSASAAVKNAPAKAESKTTVPVPTMDPEDSVSANGAAAAGADNSAGAVKAAPLSGAPGAADASQNMAAENNAAQPQATATAGQADKSGNAAAANSAKAETQVQQNAVKSEAAAAGTITANNGGAAKPAAAAESQPTAAKSAPAAPVDSAPMIWPVKGNIISAYGQRTGTTTNDGIDIAVAEGTPVKAADGGTVIYAGDGLKEFGNTILIRHEDNVVTVYGHNSKLLVHRGQQVQKGEEIAQSGSSGNATVAKLHFEVRKNSAPVNPMKYLPLTH